MAAGQLMRFHPSGILSSEPRKILGAADRAVKPHPSQHAHTSRAGRGLPRFHPANQSSSCELVNEPPQMDSRVLTGAFWGKRRVSLDTMNVFSSANCPASTE